MDIFSTLKKLREIQPNPQYQMRSRNTLLNTPLPQPPLRVVWKWFISNMESAASLSLAGLSLFLIFAGFSIWKSFSPLGIARPDLEALKAEAEAIDIQIQLANLKYEESTLSTTLSVKPTPPNKTNTLGKTVPPSNVVKGETPLVPDEATTTTLSIDEALQKLAE